MQIKPVGFNWSLILRNYNYDLLWQLSRATSIPSKEALIDGGGQGNTCSPGINSDDLISHLIDY